MCAGLSVFIQAATDLYVIGGQVMLSGCSMQNRSRKGENLKLLGYRTRRNAFDIENNVASGA